MEKITAKQFELAKDICNKLNLEFDLFNSTKQEARIFIKEHIEEYNNLPTSKQLSYIYKICRYVDVKFEGKTKQEASDFIKKYEGDYIRAECKIHDSIYNTGSVSDFDMEDWCGIPPYEI